MGENKADLKIGRRTFLALLLEKGESLGFTDILVSGYAVDFPYRTVYDEYLDCGPVSGIHACLKNAVNEHVFFLSVDVPLIGTDTIMALIRTYQAQAQAKVQEKPRKATVLVNGTRLEPLIGIYHQSVHLIAAELLNSGSASVTKLAETAGYYPYHYQGDKELLKNINTPLDYAMIINQEKHS